METTRNPNDLRPHPYIAKFPRWGHDADEWTAFLIDIQDNGIRHPLQITADHLVVDGETRRQAALSLGLPEVPVVVVSEDEIGTVVVRELGFRRNLTKSAIAYLAYPLHKRVHDESIHRQQTNLKKGSELPSLLSRRSGKIRGFEEVFVQLGFSRPLFFQAQEVHELFADDPSYKALMEPKILSGDAGLGAVIAGYAGRAATLGKERRDPRPADLMLKSMSSWSAWGRYWEAIDSEQRDRVRTHLRKQCAELPVDLRAELVSELRRLQRESAS
jgi:hypothetical protein